ncbi:MAG: hypothetical protein PHU08_02700, partial [Dehalococcoidales bacterium]|nr:hypothetical protein [Dehalococcoidales bacterium]
MRYAEVSVNSPIAQRQTFSYAIPANLDIEVGQAVWVPFGSKTLQGIVIKLSPFPSVEETKDIGGVIEAHPLLSPARVSLALWLSNRYLSPLFEAVALMLPPGFERQTLTFISSSSSAGSADLSSLSAESRQVLDQIRDQGRTSLKDLERRLGKRKAQALVTQLVNRGLLTRDYEPEPVKVAPKREPYLSLGITPAEAGKIAADLHRKHGNKQAVVLEMLTGPAGTIPWAVVREKAKCTRAVVDALVRKGLITLQYVAVQRDPLAGYPIT